MTATTCPEDFHGEAAQFHGTVELVGSYAEVARDFDSGGLLQLATSSVAPPDGPSDTIIAITWRSYTGWVYDFEATDGWLVADGIIVSNCRCRKVSRSAADVQRLGLKISTGADMPPLPDPGWS